MKTYLYLSTAIISVSLATSGNAWAQCVSTQDCATLGYTESSCPNGGVKCPFGNKWACFPEPDKTAGCIIGALYYSDGTCSDKLESSKTLLGVVIYEKSVGQNGWIMTVKPVVTNIAWGKYETDIPGLGNFSSTPSDILASCTNTDVITAYGSSSTYPAAWKAKNYKPTGTPSGKSWCLPSGGLLNNLNNSTNFAKVNAGITTAGGTKLGYGQYPFLDRERVWSSSEHSYHSAWNFYTNTSGSFDMDQGFKDTSDYGYVYTVRAVMEF